MSSLIQITRRALAPLVATTLAVHLLVGCCWHQAHQGEGLGISQVAEDCHCDCCDHAPLPEAPSSDSHSTGSQSHRPHSPCHHDCQISSCLYVADSSGHYESPAVERSFDILPAELSSQVSLAQHLSLACHTHASLPSAALRAHLRFGVLQI